MSNRELIRYFVEQELGLESRLRGVTLLGEIVVEKQDCDRISDQVGELVTVYGPGQVVQLLTKECSLTMSIWLVNEAFFHFVSGTFWPNVLGKVGFELKEVNQYSSRLGKGFLAFLRQRGLPEFRQLKTRWSYLGPILGHCGIPESCLPEFFNKVLPRAMEWGFSEGAGFEELQRIVPRLYLTKPTERFLIHGGAIAENFVQRSIEMSLFMQRQRMPPVACQAGLPERVVKAFSTWWATQDSAIGRHREARRSVRRPELYFDPFQGVRVLLPPQKLEPGERLVSWDLQVDDFPGRTIHAHTEPGETTTLAEEFFLSKAFSLLKASLMVDGRQVGSWTHAGVSLDAPFLLFHPETFRLLSPSNVDSGHIGIAVMAEREVVGQSGSTTHQPSIVERFGRMPFGWGDLEAHVYDLAGFEMVHLLLGEEGKKCSIDLREDAAFRPRLVLVEGRMEVAGDGTVVFFGQAPALEVRKEPRQNLEEFLASWTLELHPAGCHQGNGDPVRIPLFNLKDEIGDPDESDRYRVSLGSRHCLGPKPWGEYLLKVKGPIGQDARYAFRVLPEVTVQREHIEWSDLSGPLQCRIVVPEGTRLRGAYPTESPREFLFQAQGHPVRLHLEITGFQERSWDIPLEVNVPLPSWAIYQPQLGQPLVSWGRRPLRLSVAELESKDAFLLVKLVTPNGIPGAGRLLLREPKRDVLEQPLDFDRDGHGKISLDPFLSAVRQRRVYRMELVLSMDLDRTIEIPCGTILSRWSPEGFTCEIKSAEVVLRWQESIPVEGRTLRVEPLLTPWEAPALIRIEDEADGQWRARCETVFPMPGKYRVTLGLHDPWTDDFLASTDTARVVEHGSQADWTRNPLGSDSGLDGRLYRMMLSHHCSEENGTESSELLDSEDGSLLTERILVCRESLAGRDDTTGLIRTLDRVLCGLPSNNILAGIARRREQTNPEVILRSKLFSRRWRRDIREENDEATQAWLPDATVEALWEVWRPLGMWGDMHVIRYNPAAESRIIQRVGRENTELLCPVRKGSTARFTSQDKSIRLKARIEGVATGHEQSPFEWMRVEPGVDLTLEGLSPPDFHGQRVLLSRNNEGQLSFEPLDSEELPPSLVTFLEKYPADMEYPFFYPESFQPIGGYPEDHFIGMVHSNAPRNLEFVRSMIPALPRGAVGPQAFLDACFDWCLRAASDTAYRKDLVETCSQNASLFFGDLEKFSPPKPTAQGNLLLSELKKRWFPNTVVEPLYGVNFLVCSVALSLLWKGLGRVSPFGVSEQEIEELAIHLYRYTPELLEHDLTMICLVEALFRSRRRRHEHRPGEADSGLDGQLQ